MIVERVEGEIIMGIDSDHDGAERILLPFFGGALLVFSLPVGFVYPLGSITATLLIIVAFHLIGSQLTGEIQDQKHVIRTVGCGAFTGVLLVGIIAIFYVVAR